MHRNYHTRQSSNQGNPKGAIRRDTPFHDGLRNRHTQG